MTSKGSEGARLLTRKGTATRERIVEAASQLMFERGVASTSTDDLRSAAGVSASQIFHYFHDKRALVRAVIAHQTEAILGAQSAFLGRMDSMEALRAWRELVVAITRQFQFKGGCPIGRLASELADSFPEARNDLLESFAKWEEGIRTGLRSMYERGELRVDADPDRLALAILATVEGGLLLSQLRRDTCALEAGLDSILDHVESMTVENGAGRSTLR
jgi:TetR/AcrR family transcriptional regulator, transcriptional repressor for nem operon